MSEKPKYVEIHARDRDDLETAFKSHDANVVCDALYSAAQHEAEWRWSQEQCLKMHDHKSLLVRSAAFIQAAKLLQ